MHTSKIAGNVPNDVELDGGEKVILLPLFPVSYVVAVELILKLKSLLPQKSSVSVTSVRA
jgi:hypothetical protein